MEEKKIKIVINSDLNDVRIADMIAEQLFAYMKIPDETAFEIRLCLTEAVNNCIIHAYAGQSGKDVDIVFSFFPDRIRLVVSDSGIQCESCRSEKAQSPPAQCSLNPEPVQTGGRGLEIIREIMDNVKYTHENSKNCLIMTKKLN